MTVNIVLCVRIRRLFVDKNADLDLDLIFFMKMVYQIVTKKSRNFILRTDALLYVLAIRENNLVIKTTSKYNRMLNICF